MPIVCPHCATSYAVDSATLGVDGRTVRCSRCKEVWLARPGDAGRGVARALAPSMAAGPGLSASRQSAASGWPAAETGRHEVDPAPHIDSPSIAGGLPATPDGEPNASKGPAETQPGDVVEAQPIETPFENQTTPQAHRPARQKGATTLSLLRGSSFSLPTACAALAALMVALLLWRADIVRLMPQTAAFYKLLGIEVNLRGLTFKDVKASTEFVEGKPVLVIEGNVVGEGRRPVELPRLRFVLRDGAGAEIYAWNAVLEQAVLKPGEAAWFRSRLATPPAEGRSLDVRFFNRRDIAAGAA